MKRTPIPAAKANWGGASPIGLRVAMTRLAGECADGICSAEESAKLVPVILDGFTVGRHQSIVGHGVEDQDPLQHPLKINNNILTLHP